MLSKRIIEILLLFGSLSLVLSVPTDKRKYNNIKLPFSSDGRWIKDSDGGHFTYVGGNWPGHGAVMIPEGLNQNSIGNIADKIAEAGMNSVRLTFAIEMIDDIYSNKKDTTVEESFLKVLGDANGTDAFEGFLKNNPQFNHKTTRLDVFDAVASALKERGIYVHLDNHISKAMWCCSATDGNAWFGDTYFDVDNWKRGLAYMAKYGKKWSNLASLGLRNELRQIGSGKYDENYPYSWSVWKTEVLDAAAKVHEANSEILIFLSGLNYDTNLNPIVFGTSLGDSDEKFDLNDYKFKNKLVFELHTYASVGSCSSFWNSLYNDGFAVLNESDSRVVNRLPMVLTEWGHSENDSDEMYDKSYHTCLHQFADKHQFGWMLWSLAGSYYWRSETYDFEDTWGLLSKNWIYFRGEKSSRAIFDMIEDTLS